MLLNPSHLDGVPLSDVKHLSTRMVHDWREKSHKGVNIWLRRARYVGREYNWMSQRTDTFAPASSALLTRLLPILFVSQQQINKCIIAIDIGDAFLTVDQVSPTLVVHRQRSGVECQYALGKVLPGQRVAGEKWNSAFTGYLAETLQIHPCPAYPTLLRNPDGRCNLQMHVDDVLSLTDTSYAEDVLKPALLAKYKIKV